MSFIRGIINTVQIVVCNQCECCTLLEPKGPGVADTIEALDHLGYTTHNNRLYCSTCQEEE